MMFRRAMLPLAQPVGIIDDEPHLIEDIMASGSLEEPRPRRASFSEAWINESRFSSECRPAPATLENVVSQLFYGLCALVRRVMIASLPSLRSKLNSPDPTRRRGVGAERYDDVCGDPDGCGGLGGSAAAELIGLPLVSAPCHQGYPALERADEIGFRSGP